MNIKDVLINAIKGIIDRSDKIIDLATTAGIAYYGYQVNNHWTGALTGVLGYKLARTDNIVSGGAGVGILGALGVMQLTKPFWAIQPPAPPAPMESLLFTGLQLDERRRGGAGIQK